MSDIIEAKVVVIGAGPVGLWQAYYLGLQGISNVHIVDILPYAGGQCSELYPTKPIFDVPGLPGVTGNLLTTALLRQLEPFQPVFHFGKEITQFQEPEKGLFELATSDNSLRLQTRAIVMASGLGRFTPNLVKAPGAVELQDQIHYKITDLNQFKGLTVAVLGGGDSALDWAVELQKAEADVILIHRSPEFRAHKHTVAKYEALIAEGLADKVIGNITKIHRDSYNHFKISVTGFDGVTRAVHSNEVCCFYGLAPKIGWDWNAFKYLKPVGNRVLVNTENFESTHPGIFAVGDAAFYPGKQKLIVSGFHEACLATYKISEYALGRKLSFAYTTTSEIMHKRLGVQVELHDF